MEIRNNINSFVCSLYHIPNVAASCSSVAASCSSVAASCSSVAASCSSAASQAPTAEEAAAEKAAVEAAAARVMGVKGVVLFGGAVCTMTALWCTAAAVAAVVKIAFFAGLATLCLDGYHVISKGAVVLSNSGVRTQPNALLQDTILLGPVVQVIETPRYAMTLAIHAYNYIRTHANFNYSVG